MIIGNGMLANAFKSFGSFDRRICIFASGVSNSHCHDVRQFKRETELLRQTLDSHDDQAAFVYFGTCSVYDPASQTHPYVLHKLAMEQIVQVRPSGLVVRLPQVAGPNASPYTLLAVLCESIRSGRVINVWEHATRNVIDVIDVAKIVSSWMAISDRREKIINVANPTSCSIKSIIGFAESVLGRAAVLNIEPTGSAYDIDISLAEPLIESLRISFDEKYIARAIARYYL